MDSTTEKTVGAAREDVSALVARVEKWLDHGAIQNALSPYEIRMIRDLSAATHDLRSTLKRYRDAYPAFRIKPIGAPGSPARIEQENLMALEDAANAAIAKAEGR